MRLDEVIGELLLVVGLDDDELVLGDELDGDELGDELGFCLPPPGMKTAMAVLGAPFLADFFAVAFFFFFGAAFFLPLWGAAFFLACFFFFLAIPVLPNAPDYVALRPGAQGIRGRKT